MTNFWLPGLVPVDLGMSGGDYDEINHRKLLWHTTEGSSVAGARGAFADYPPHLCYDPWADYGEQYLPLNRHSYSLKSSESDDEACIQVEIVGYADESHAWPDEILRRLAARVVKPIVDLVHIPANYQTFYTSGQGIVLADPDSPIRLSDSSFRDYAGHLGHQHAPSPDSHWDPGGLPIYTILVYAEEDELPTPQDVWNYPMPHPHNASVIGWAKDVLWENNSALARVEAEQKTMKEDLAAIKELLECMSR
jgi:hypothetical protein